MCRQIIDVTRYGCSHTFPVRQVGIVRCFNPRCAIGYHHPPYCQGQGCRENCIQVWGHTTKHMILAVNAICPVCHHTDDLLLGCTADIILIIGALFIPRILCWHATHHPQRRNVSMVQAPRCHPPIPLRRSVPGSPYITSSSSPSR